MKLDRYQKYKESGVKWLGAVPEHWRIAPLWTLFKRAKRTDHPGEQLLSVYRDYGVVPKSSRDDNKNKPSDDLSVYQLVLPGDLVINKMKAWQGSVAISSYRGLVSPAYFVYESVSNQNSRFLHYLFRSDRYIVGYVASSKGVRVGQWDLDPDYHSRTAVLLPSLEEQNRIAEFLDQEMGQIDALVEKQQRLIELLKEKRQAVVSRVVTRGLAPKTKMQHSGADWLGDVPAHWDVRRLATLYKEINEAGSDELPILTVSIHTGVSDRQLADEELDRTVNRSEDVSKYKRVAPGDLVYNMMRAWQGGFGTVTVPGQISPAYVVARPTSNFSSRFIELLLRTPQAVEEIRGCSYGVADFRLRLYWDNFKNIRVALPPESEQAEILAHIERLDLKFNDLIEKATVSIEKLQERRSALISAAVTGKIDVRSLATTEAA